MSNLASSKKIIYGFGTLGLIISLALSFLGWYVSPVIPIALFILFLLVVRTDLYILLIAFLVPLSIPLTDIAGGIGGSLPTEPLIAILMIFTVAKLMAGYTFDKAFIFHPLSIAILAGLIWMLVSVYFSEIPTNSIKFWIIRFMYVLTFYFLAGHLFKNPKMIMRLFWVLLVSTTILVLYTNIRHAGEGFVRTHSYFISQPFFMDHGIYAAAVAFLFPVALFFILNGHTLGLNTMGSHLGPFYVLLYFYGAGIFFHARCLGKFSWRPWLFGYHEIPNSVFISTGRSIDWRFLCI